MILRGWQIKGGVSASREATDMQGVGASITTLSHPTGGTLRKPWSDGVGYLDGLLASRYVAPCFGVCAGAAKAHQAAQARLLRWTKRN
jgi:hypothetical protein